MKTLLVTGAGGFLGRHVCRKLQQDYDILGTDVPDVNPVPGVKWEVAHNEKTLAVLVHNVRPDLVIHAAFINRKPPDLSDYRYLDNSLSVNLPLFEAVAQIQGRLLLVSSSAVYGNAYNKTLIDESCPLAPVTVYGLAKAFQEMMLHYHSGKAIRSCIVRPFNLVGPGQGLGMIFPDWVKKAKAFVEGKTPDFRVKHLKAARDFVDVRDAARAISLVVRDFMPGEVFNISSGLAVRLEDVASALESIVAIPLKVSETENHLAGVDVMSQCGSFEKIRSVYNWAPLIDWRTSLKDVWESSL